MGNEKPSIEEGQIIQWPKEKGQRKLKIERHETH